MDERHSGRKRRWLRFSIRTLLIAVTIFCVWLGWQMHLANQQRALVQAVIKLGGTVRYANQFPNDALDDTAQPSMPAWIRGIFGNDFFCSVIWVMLAGVECKLIYLLSDA